MANKFGLAAWALLGLAGCGTGSHTANDSPGVPLSFSDTVAIGSALKGVVVKAACGGGANGSSTPTSSDGYYLLSLQGTLPCALQAVEPITGSTLRSLTTSQGTANISLLTEAIYVFANGDAVGLVDAKRKLGSLMQVINSPLAGTGKLNAGAVVEDGPATGRL